MEGGATPAIPQESESDQKLNVIRIKRKRGEEPVSSLLVDLPVPKKTYIESFKQLSTHDKDPVATDSKRIFCLVGTVSSHDTPARLKDKIKEAQQKRKLLLRTNIPSTEKSLEHKEAALKLQKEARKQEIKLVRNTNKVGSEGFSDLFHLVDLVKVEEASTPESVGKSELSTDTKSTDTKTNNLTKENDTKTKTNNKPTDELMCNYMPMVREYLTTNNIPRKKDKTTTKPNTETEEEGYVYDVYYADDSLPRDSQEGVVIARIETFDENLNEENEYDDDDTDSDDEENRVTDIYPDEDEDPEFEDEYGSTSDEYATSSDDEYIREAGYDREESDDDGDFWR